jgi:hypothetical protein
LEINGSKILSGKLFIWIYSYASPTIYVDLFVNDAYVGKCQGTCYPEKPIEFNIVSLLRIGKNVIAIKADFERGPSSDYYWGATGDIKYQ